MFGRKLLCKSNLKGLRCQWLFWSFLERRNKICMTKGLKQGRQGEREKKRKREKERKKEKQIKALIRTKRRRQGEAERLKERQITERQ